MLGYDDADISPYATPPLTTIHAPIAEAAAAACRHVLNLCAGDVPAAASHHFDCAVVWRESVGTAPHAALGPEPRASITSAWPGGQPLLRRHSTNQY